MIINFIYLLLFSFVFFWFYTNIKKIGLKWIIKGFFQIGILVLFIGGFFKIFFNLPPNLFIKIFFMFFPLEIILFLITKLGVIKLGLNSAYFKKDNIDRELIDLVTKPVLRKTSARSLRAMCIGMSSRDEKFKASHLLRKLSASKKVPFLLIWGEKDNFIPLFVGKKIANFYRWVKLKIVSNSGHCIHDEDPLVFNRISYEWIKDLKTF